MGTGIERPGGATGAGAGGRSLIGQTVASYRVVARLGEGGMGAVYLAEHTLLGRKAAVKVLHPEFGSRPEIVRRFFNEARASALLKHSGIVDIYDFGELPDGSGFIVMELLEGDSLATRLRHLRTMPLHETLAILHQMSRALGAAHGKGIVHRDLKPDNVFLVHDEDDPTRERVKILDFGIAKLTEEASSGRTRTGALLGTPVYMSPEQAEGAGNVDLRSDIYAMGVMAYEMLIGEPPFLGDGFGKILALHIHMPPKPLREHDPRIAPEVDDFVLHLLEKDRTQRPQTCVEVARLIEQIVPADRLRIGGAPASAEDAPRPAPATGAPRASAGSKTSHAATAAAPAAQAAQAPQAPQAATGLATHGPTGVSEKSATGVSEKSATGVSEKSATGVSDRSGTAVVTSAGTRVDEGALTRGMPAAPARNTTLSGSASTSQVTAAPRATGGRNFVVALVALAVLGAAGGGAYYFVGVMDDGGASKVDEDEPVLAPTPKRPTAKGTAAPTSASRDDETTIAETAHAEGARAETARAETARAETAAEVAALEPKTAKGAGHKGLHHPAATAAPGESGAATAAAKGAPATLTLISDPPAAVKVDGKPVGGTPTTTTVAPGKHVILFEAGGLAGGRTKSVPVKLKAGDSKTVSVDLH